MAQNRRFSSSSSWFFSFNLSRPYSGQGRPSGGVVIYCANKHSGQIKVWKQDLQSCSYLWLQCNRRIFQTDQPVFICGVYLPPAAATMYHHIISEELFDSLLMTTAEAFSNGHVILTGGFNARTGSLSDELDANLAEHVELPTDLHACSYQPPLRQSLDTTIDKFGHFLLQFCQASQLHILNGRITGDIPAQYTSHANAGHSCIDYFITSPGISSRAVSLVVQDMVSCSEHFPVLLTLHLPSIPSPSTAAVSQTPLLRYDPARVELFQAEFSDTELSQRLQQLSAEAGFQLL